ncbi:response regulator [Deinococcus hopiensis]|uniref:Response regulator receiver modulated metal dependent phosphohydrolase n=1 Tax=Deinococcus hopiensis KR-140 TaxID=695939 RepID=A0A1W1UBK4_9DEIO|nr:two-component system response regulator [Deinococcus hopiensis]SMB78420.1 response regulator receiver modulated metal dependent phosphohydrolase [Deinococcus hopiensis KR-140]
MKPPQVTTARILIVDDQEANTTLLREMLEEEGYSGMHVINDARLAVGAAQSFAPDLVLLDLMMPYMDGFQVMDQLLEALPSTVFLPVLVLTADATSATKRRALASGATDFITKPFDVEEVLLRVRNLLQMRFFSNALKQQNDLLEVRVAERTRELLETQAEVLSRLATAAEYRDDDTGEHTWRVAAVAASLARELGWADSQVELLQQAARLHDVGKVGIPDAILLKPGRLTQEEFTVMKSHAAIGGRIMSNGSSPMLQLAQEIACSHHERWDGSGYPNGLAGEAIPVSGRIVAVADVYDALTNERPYKQAWSHGDALAEIQNQAGRQFDPQVVELFLRIMARPEGSI